MPLKMRTCPKCQERNGLSYYHEWNGDDLYYCENCFKVVVWDGFEVKPTDQEAYPNRDK